MTKLALQKYNFTGLRLSWQKESVKRENIIVQWLRNGAVCSRKLKENFHITSSVSRPNKFLG